MRAFLYSSKLVASVGAALCIFLSSCGGGGGSSSETANTSQISSLSIARDNPLSSTASTAASSIEDNSNSSTGETGSYSTSSSSIRSETQVTSSTLNSIVSSSATRTASSSSEKSGPSDVASVASNISSNNNISSSTKSSSPNSSTTSISHSSSSLASSTLSSTAASSSNANASSSQESSKQNTSSVVSTSSFLSSNSSLASISSSSLWTGTPFHLRGTHNAWVEGDLFTQVSGSTTDLEICRNFLPVTGGANFKIDPNGGWGDDAFPLSSLTTSGWTKIVINGYTKEILVFDKNLSPNCDTESSSISSSSSSIKASSSSLASSLNSFSFPSVYDAPLNTDILSAPITISGVETGDFLSIEGGEYSVNGFGFEKYTTLIANGDTVVLKLKSATKENTLKQAILTIVGRDFNRTATFSVTTLPDMTPDAFSFTPIKNSQLNITRYSESILVSGIDGAVPISIAGEKASYSINNKPYSNLPNTVTNGQMVKVNLRSSDTLNTTTSAVLTIGKISRTFTVTTVAENSPPSAEFMFPSPQSLTNEETVLVRGKSNDLSNIVSVKVNDIEVTTTDNYNNWQARVPLIKGENTLLVATRDSLDNYIYNAATIKIRRETGSTPNSINRFDGPLSIAMDKARNRLIVSDAAAISDTPDSQLYTVNLTNGARTPFNTGSVWLSNANDTAMDEAHNRILAVDEHMGYIVAVDLTSGATTPLTNYNIPYGPTPRLSVPCCIAVDAARNRAIVADYGLKQLIAIDLTTGGYSVFSSNTIPNSNNKFNAPHGIVIDEKHNRALVLDSNSSMGLVIAVDLTSGARSLVSINSPQSNNYLLNPYSIAFDEKRNRLLISESNGGGTYSVDLTTGTTSTFESLRNSNKIVIDSDKDVAYSASYWLQSVILVDLITNEEVIFSK